MAPESAPDSTPSGEFGVWELTAPRALETPVLEGPIDADIAIVGAGFTGLSTALHLAERGERPIIVEAAVPGFGASGRNAGWMQPDWWLKNPSSVVAEFGRERAERLTRWLATGPTRLQTWTDKYNLSIGLDPRGLLLGIESAASLQKTEPIARAWQALGINLQFVDGSEVSRQVAASRYRAGVVFADGAVLNPLALSRELARACLQQGVRIFSRSRVLKICRRERAWHLESASGYVRARRLVLATDVSTAGLWPAVSRAMATWRLAVIGSTPYPALDELLRVGRPFGEHASATLFSLRADSAGRLVTSTFLPLSGGSRLTAVQMALPVTRRFRRVFPDLPAPDWQYVHFGDVGLSRDLLPRICAIGDDAWTAYGYSGNGVNASLLAGGELASHAAGNSDEAVFPLTNPRTFSLRHLARFGVQCVHGPLVRALAGRSR
jgi:glycine/D-amino acid oxidase-like deaminating enzyme